MHLLSHCRTCAPRLGSSIKHNLTYYLSIGVAGVVGIGLLLISGRLHAGDLLPLAMLLSNTYGVWRGPLALQPVIFSLPACIAVQDPSPWNYEWCVLQIVRKMHSSLAMYGTVLCAFSNTWRP